VPGAARTHHSNATALIALIACQVGLHGCMQGVRMAAPLAALRQGHGEWWIGMLMACFAIFPALLAIPAGRMADRHGYHRPVMIAATLSIVGALTAAASGHFISLCIAAAACGAGSGFGMIAIQRSASRMARDPTERIRIFSWIALAPAVAGLLGPLMAGTVIDAAGFRMAFAALAVLPVVTLCLSRLVPVEARVITAPGAARPAAWAMLREPMFRRLILVNWLVSASWDVHGFALPILGHERGLSATAIGGVLAAYAVASMSVRLLIPLIAHRLSQRVMLSGALLFTALIFVVYPLVGTAWAMAGCAAVLGIALGAVQPAIMATLHDVAPLERQGEALALRSMTVHMSAALMPLTFGVAGAAVGVATLFWGMAGLLGLGGWQARRIGPQKKTPTSL
jgi:MFS family permease